MIKAKSENIITFPSNQEITSKYLEYFNHSRISQCSHKTSLKLFENFINKSFEYLEVKDVKEFHQYLNTSNNWTLTTKKFYFHIAKRFIEDFLQNYMDCFKPKKLILFLMFLKDSKNFKWRKEHFHKESERDNNVVLEKSELVKILNHLKRKDMTKYLMVRVIAETGMRRGECLSINLSRKYKGVDFNIEEDLKNRFVHVLGKTGKKIYFVSRSLSNLLIKFLEQRNKTNVGTNAFFLSNRGNRVSNHVINDLLSGKKGYGNNKRRMGVCEILGINKIISPKTFRLTLNDLRERMDCPEKYLKILLNHKESGVNYTHYVSDETKRAKFLEYYDLYNPYKNLKL